mgnify:FL=1
MGVGYKLFKVKTSQKGKLFPLYVLSDKETPVGVWIKAEEGTKSSDGFHVKSKLGDLCYRPGWHLSDYPLATHIGKKDSNGNIYGIHKDEVWCEVEYSDEVNYQMTVNKLGMNKNGTVIPKNAYLARIPTNGYYRYKTNPKMLGDWIIAGAIKINRILTDDEVNHILISNGLTPMPREGGVFDNKKYGIAI